MGIDNSLGLVPADMYTMTNSHCGGVLCLVLLAIIRTGKMLSLAVVETY